MLRFRGFYPSIFFHFPRRVLNCTKSTCNRVFNAITVLF